MGILSGAVALSGIAVACGLFLGQRRLVAWLAGTPPGRLLARWWVQGWGFDWLYDRLFVRPFVWFARVNIRDGIDLAILTIPARLARAQWRLWYAPRTDGFAGTPPAWPLARCCVVAMVFV